MRGGARPDSDNFSLSIGDEFGEALRALRRRRSLTQLGLAEALSGSFARSTLANVEAGREMPSQRLFDTLVRAFPEDRERLQKSFEGARSMAGAIEDEAGPKLVPTELGGACTVERLDIGYVFGESRSPQEIFEVRTVRATAAGVSSYRLKLKQSSSTSFATITEVLWGGDLREQIRRTANGQTLYLTTVDFGRRLRRGERHVFALRTWIERDQEPDTRLSVTMTIPTRIIALHARFTGPRPQEAWSFGPCADDALAPNSLDDEGATWLALSDGGVASLVVANPQLGVEYGLGWSW